MEELTIKECVADIMSAIDIENDEKLEKLKKHLDRSRIIVNTSDFSSLSTKRERKSLLIKSISNVYTELVSVDEMVIRIEDEMHDRYSDLVEQVQTETNESIAIAVYDTILFMIADGIIEWLGNYSERRLWLPPLDGMEERIVDEAIKHCDYLLNECGC